MAEKIKSKLKIRLLILSIIPILIVAFIVWQIITYFKSGQWEQTLFYLFVTWYMPYYSLYIPSSGYSYVVSNFVFLFCVLGLLIYSVIRTRQMFKVIDQFEKEGGPNSNPIIQFLRVGMYKDAVNQYFEDGCSYESANILYSPLFEHLPILREVWRLVASRTEGNMLKEEAEKLLEISSQAPKEVQIQIRNMIIEQGIYEMGAPPLPDSKSDFIFENLEEEKSNRCMICGKILTEIDDQVMCPYCFENACREHLMEHLEKDEKCPSCKRPIKEFFKE
ncbi:MAG: hypothetical protein QW279_11815 [Candidatus Jordarchaeaceae archaeon]